MHKRSVYLSGIDLLDETPVLDIKPYVAAYDCLPDTLVADWVSTSQPSIQIEWESNELIAVIHTLASKSVHYQKSPEIFVAAIEEVLQVDVRSKYQTRRWTTPDNVNYQIVDNVRVKYRFTLSPQSAPSVGSGRIQILAVEEIRTNVLYHESVRTNPA